MNTENWMDEELKFSSEDVFSFDIKITNPEHIPGVVNRLTELAKERPVVAGLDHQESPHAMLGVNEEVGRTDLIPGYNLFRRPDSGNTVYTDDSKICTVKGGPIGDQRQKTADTFTEWLHKDLIESIEDYNNNHTIYPSGRDLEVKGDQIVGVATSFDEGAVIGRAYWAEGVPEIYDLMEKDGIDSEDRERHRAQMETSEQVLKGFYESHDLDAAETLSSKDFLINYGEEQDFVLYIDLLEDYDRGMERDVCFL